MKDQLFMLGIVFFFCDNDMLLSQSSLRQIEYKSIALKQ